MQGKITKAKRSKVSEKVERFILSNKLIGKSSKVIAGLSGGPDSVCLIMILAELGFDVTAVHCNFHLRGAESMRDEAFARNLCCSLGIKMIKTDFDTIGYAEKKKISIEMAARELRYSEFRKIMKETEAECIAVGHHENDNTETMLLNMVRGTGIKGMCGMQPKNNDVVRPLLCLTRKDIIDYLDEHKQGYVTDRTNLEDEYARNKVRLDIMPILEQINRGAAGNMASTMENLNEVYKVYRHAIKRDIAFCARVADNGETRIDISKLKETASPISVLHELIGDRGFNKAELKDMLTCGCGKVFGKKGSRVAIDRTCIITEAPHYPVPVIEKRIVDVADMKIERDGLHAYLDADKLQGQLTMRTPKTGDSFAPFGMKGKRKLLSDYMTDQKMSLFEKERQPLLMDGEEIAWVVGRRSSELYKVDGKTKRVVILYLKSWQK